MFVRAVIVLLCVLVAVSDGQREPDCSRYQSNICTLNYSPVCGSDGKTYGNECELCSAIKTSKNKILIQKQGECDQPQQPDCSRYPSNICTLNYSPVCGSDGKTYGNECELCVAIKTSKNKILIQKEGECDQPQQPNCKPNPSKMCTKIYKPVCGSDGKTYSNECELCIAIETSKTKISIVKRGECDQPAQPIMCPMNYSPVCGSDGKTYGNECTLRAANETSKTPIFIVKQGECDQAQQPNCKPNPSNSCTKDYSPVCGSDGKTYNNECELCVSIKTSKTKVLIQKQGECDQPPQPIMCPMNYSPVCGSDGKTYGNECTLRAANQASKTKISIVKKGECEKQPDCSRYSSGICTLIHSPVCGSDGKTYGNECMLCAAIKASKKKIFIRRQGKC